MSPTLAIAVIVLFIIVIVWSRSKQANVSNRVVLFYRPSCPACQQFKPIWGDVKTSMPKITFEEINTETDNVEVKERQYGVSIETVPAVFIIKDGIVKKYEGNREKSDLMSALSPLL